MVHANKCESIISTKSKTANNTLNSWRVQVHAQYRRTATVENNLKNVYLIYMGPALPMIQCNTTRIDAAKFLIEITPQTNIGSLWRISVWSADTYGAEIAFSNNAYS